MALTFETVPLSKYQGAHETTAGTLIAAKRKVYFMDGELKEYVDRSYVTERRASMTAHYRSFPTKHYSEISGATFAPTFEDLPWLAGLFLDGTTTPAPTNVTGQRHTFQSAAVPALKTASLEVGDSRGNPYAIPYILGNRLELGWSKTSPMTGSADFLGAIPVQQAFTSNLSDRTTEDINGALAVAYIDTTTIGSTAVTNVLEAKLSLDNHWNQFYALTGVLSPADAYQGEARYAQLDLTVAFTDTTEFAKFQTVSSAESPRMVRIKVSGSTITGTSPSLARSMTLDWYGIWETAEFGTQDGMRVVNLKGRSEYNSTPATDWKLVVDNAITAANVTSTY